VFACGSLVVGVDVGCKEQKTWMTQPRQMHQHSDIPTLWFAAERLDPLGSRGENAGAGGLDLVHRAWGNSLLRRHAVPSPFLTAALCSGIRFDD
jgi:hypothetical protein